MTNITLFPHQTYAVNEVEKSWQAGNKNVLVVLPTGAGKCLGLNTPVLMYDGSIKMVQDVNAGDLLMGVDSTPRIVKSTITGREMLYRVTPVKGDSYVVNESHILSLKQTGLKSKPKYRSQEGKGKVVNVTVKDYLTKSKTFKYTHKGWRTGVEWSDKALPELLPPYLLGVWLGDGSTNDTSITTADIEIVDYLRDYTNKYGFGLTEKHQVNNKSKFYSITNGKKRLTGLKPLMRQYSLLGFKHIPNDYKINSRSKRLELLAGILDSDGHLTKGHYDVVLKSERLMDDLIFLARSLGFAAYKKPCKKTCINTGATGEYFRTTISGDVSVIPTKLERHQPESRKQKKSVLVTGITVEPIGEGDYYGFDISGDRLFMLGDFTVTHNTLVKAEVARKELFNQFAHNALNNSGVTIVFAHRDVLLSQISDAMCMMHVKHTFIAAKHTVREITNLNLTEHGNSFYDENSRVIVASVDSFLAKMKKGQIDYLVPHVTLWQLDEAHHLLRDNKWGQCVSYLTNARGLGVTATPLRADGKGLGRGVIVKHDADGQPIYDNDGVFDDMIIGSDMGQLIDIGRLSAYKIYVPPTKVDMTGMRVTASGDYNQRELAKRTDKADITGDVVEHYIRIANGLQAITYCINIAHSEHVAEQFNKAGIPSKALSSKTPIKERQTAIKDFKAGRIKNLVNSDLFGEGFDVPALVVGIMLRKTESYSLFKQQFGRPLRVLQGKEFGIIIDHVNNVRDMMSKYGLSQPHDDPEWSLERASKTKSNQGGETVGRVCPECAAFYIPSSSTYVCPYCSHTETEAEQLAATKEFQAKQGNLVELDVNFINELMVKRQQIWQTAESVRNKFHFHTPPVVKNSAVNNHLKRQFAHTVLVGLIQRWCADIGKTNGWDIKTVQQEFELEFGINILKAQTLSEREALELTEKIKNEYA